jgi:hypothetical protein
MPTRTSVSFGELLTSFEWVSSGFSCEDAAYVSRVTGKIFYSSSSDDVAQELPADIDDETVYLFVPNKQDLDLGRGLALRFAEAYLPESLPLVYGFFRRHCAYSRFKALLERTNQLERWYEFEQTAVEHALRQWSAEIGLQLKP